jgi:hypothetical protein
MFRGVDRTLEDKGRDLNAEIQRAAFKSFDRLEKLLEAASSEQVVMHIAQDMLDRAGYSKKLQVQTETNIHIDPLDAQILLETLTADAKARKAREANPESLKGVPHPLTERDPT